MTELEKSFFIIDKKIDLLADCLGYNFSVDFEYIDGVSPEVEIYKIIEDNHGKSD